MNRNQNPCRGLAPRLILLFIFYYGPIHANTDSAKITSVFNQLFSYLPTTATKTNCDVRAEYIAAELNLANIPNQRVYINQCLTTRDSRLTSNRNEKWHWHVAVAIKGSNSALVVDPSFHSSPLDVYNWTRLAINNRKSAEYYVEFVDLQQTNNEERSPFCNQIRSETFYPELNPRVSAENFLFFCATLYEDIKKERLTLKQRRAKQNRLIDRSIHIAKQLYDPLSFYSFESPEAWEVEFAQKCRMGTGK